MCILAPTPGYRHKKSDTREAGRILRGAEWPKSIASGSAATPCKAELNADASHGTEFHVMSWKRGKLPAQTRNKDGPDY